MWTLWNVFYIFFLGGDTQIPAVHCSDSRTGSPVNVISDYAHKLNERLGCLRYSMIWPNGVMELTHHPGVSQLTLLKKRFQNYCLLLFYSHSVMHFPSSYMLKKGFYATHGIWIKKLQNSFPKRFPKLVNLAKKCPNSKWILFVGPQQAFAFQHISISSYFHCHNCHTVMQIFYYLNQHKFNLAQQIQLQWWCTVYTWYTLMYNISNCTLHHITIEKQYKKQTVKIFFTIYFWKSNE